MAYILTKRQLIIVFRSQVRKLTESRDENLKKKTLTLVLEVNYKTEVYCHR